MFTGATAPTSYNDSTMSVSSSLQQTNNIPSNRISSVTTTDTVNYTYDASGNVTYDGVHSYTYASENRVVSVDSGTTATYAYYHQNRRYRKTVGSTATHYVWEGAQVMAELNGSIGTVLTDNVYSGARMIAKVEGGTTQYFLSDRLSTRFVLTASGGPVNPQSWNRYTYDCSIARLTPDPRPTCFRSDEFPDGREGQNNPQAY